MNATLLIKRRLISFTYVSGFASPQIEQAHFQNSKSQIEAQMEQDI